MIVLVMMHSQVKIKCQANPLLILWEYCRDISQCCYWGDFEQVCNLKPLLSNKYMEFQDLKQNTTPTVFVTWDQKHMEMSKIWPLGRLNNTAAVPDSAMTVLSTYDMSHALSTLVLSSSLHLNPKWHAFCRETDIFLHVSNAFVLCTACYCVPGPGPYPRDATTMM